MTQAVDGGEVRALVAQWHYELDGEAAVVAGLAGNEDDVQRCTLITDGSRNWVDELTLVLRVSGPELPARLGIDGSLLDLNPAGPVEIALHVYPDLEQLHSDLGYRLLARLAVTATGSETTQNANNESGITTTAAAHT